MPPVPCHDSERPGGIEQLESVAVHSKYARICHSSEDNANNVFSGSEKLNVSEGGGGTRDLQACSLR